LITSQRTRLITYVARSVAFGPGNDWTGAETEAKCSPACRRHASSARQEEPGLVVVTAHSARW